RMLNLDSEDDGLIFIGCAGGCDTKLTMRPAPVATPPTANAAFRVSVTGLRGGHSGTQIHENRGNAVKLLARLLREAQRGECKFEMARLAGGGKHNAIPREATADLVFEKGADKPLRAAAEAFLERARLEFEGIDDGLKIEIKPIEKAPVRVLRERDRDRLLQLLEALPHGVMGMSAAVPGMVETSNNIAVVEPEGDLTVVWTSSRSSV